MSTINIEIDEGTLRRLVIEELERRLGSVGFKESDVRIEVKSKHNWKAEWEEAAFRASLYQTL